jgi:hypothetical protein
LKASPSLKGHLKDIFIECYQDARKLVSIASQITLNTFPELPIVNLEQVLDENWLP